MPDFDAEYWDERYRAKPSVWGAEPNQWVAAELVDLPAGRALDLACGEGRNAIWLASKGWQVTAVDISGVALSKGAEAAQRYPSELDPTRVRWVQGDATRYVTGEPVDLALLCYLQLPAAERHAAISSAATAVRPGGTFLMIGHDSRNRLDGTGGPQNPDVLYTAGDIAAHLADVAAVEFEIVRADEMFRKVEDADRPAIDALLRAVRVR